jgi:tetratricopeptide (TPR) repeat protein
MRYRTNIIITAVLVASFAGTLSIAAAQDDLDALVKKIDELSDAQRYSEAIAVGKHLVASIERQFGINHANVGTSLNNLADLYQAQGLFAEAEPLYRRSAAILEKNFGSGSPYLAAVLNHWGRLYVKQARYPDANPFWSAR